MKSLQTSVRASEGIAIGRAFVVHRAAVVAREERGCDEYEQQLFAVALAQSRAQIEQFAEDNDIFAAHLEIVDDPILSEAVESHIADGKSADEAVAAASDELVAMFEAMDTTARCN